MSNANVVNTVQLSKPNRNGFDLSHVINMSGRFGKLLPACAIECVPGDKFEIGCDAFVRFAPMLAPIMHRVDFTIHYFFVPNRIIWPNWEKFITNDVSAPVHPYLTMSNAMTAPQQAFMDYFGVPPFGGGTSSLNVNALPVAAYQKIYDEWYRNQNVISPVPTELSDGSNNVSNFCVMRYRAWEADYFTGSLPWAQKGPSVEIPLGEVEIDPEWTGGASGSVPMFQNYGGGYQVGTTSVTQNAGIKLDPLDVNVAYDPDGSLIVGSTTINDLRRAFKLQEWFERNARGGTRYVEQILAHFGVRSSDQRMQRPEYITGVKSPVVISEVLNSVGPMKYTDGGGVTHDMGSAQGDMAGHGVAVAKGHYGKYFCEEHGWIIGIASVMPKTMYEQGVPRKFSKDHYLDYYWPSFAHLGEREVKQKELYAYGANQENTFGYMPIYSEYKLEPNRVVGDFRISLDYWHIARIFGGPPTLSQQFIECNPDNDDIERIFAVHAGDDNIWMNLHHKINAYRPMPRFGTPML